MSARNKTQLSDSHVKSSAPRQLTRKVLLETLESRDLMAVDNLWFTADRTLVVRTDNSSTHVEVRLEGSNYRIHDVTTNRTWRYAVNTVRHIEFQGGAGNDRFVNHAANLSIRAFGNAGHDHLQGHNGADVLVGGDGNDTLVGQGGNDEMWGGSGNDSLTGDLGNDTLQGNQGNDRLMGGDGNDVLFGQEDMDYLNGGLGSDQLMGGEGWDTLISIDDSGADRLWGGGGVDNI